ncbi:MAG: amino acid adenylation domain-containing protein [Polyangiales bacterium]
MEALSLRSELVRVCRGPSVPLPAGDLCAAFRRQVRATSDAPALVFGEDMLTYRELDLASDALAAQLMQHGVTAGSLVALCARRGLALAVSMLAVLKTGAAYVPLDPDSPSSRVRSILRESQPALVLAHEGTVALDEARLAKLTWMLLEEPSAIEDAPSMLSRAGADDLAYVIYTSGSTGTPKGVEVRHVSLLNHALRMAELYALAPQDRVLCSASIGFDVAAEQLFPALLSGAAVVVRPEDLFRSLESFDAFLRSAELSTLILPTAFFHEWAREIGAGRLTLPASVRAVGVGTEQVSAELLALFLSQAHGRVRFLQGYGPTEATVTCTAYLHDGRALRPGEAVPIGLPLANTEAWVLDEQRAVVEDGSVGELYVGGVGLARGYLGREDLTTERFVPHPFQDGARLYRTGDMVRRAEDGQLLFIGREDFQIKVRGHRVEPREIEDVLCAQPGVREALVMLRGNASAQQLVAYVVGELDVQALTVACRAHLPAYMVPSAFVQLASFPMTLNQKIDRKALPEPRAVARASAGVRNDLELMVARSFAEALGIGADTLSSDDDFFALGGDSLRALRMLQLLRGSAERPLALADLFAAPTIRGLAEHIKRGGTVDKPSVLCLKPGHGTPLFLVCGIQIYQALASALPGDSPVYSLLLPSEGLAANGAARLPHVEQFAAQYIKLMRAHTPHGPYALGGLSFGGAVAYEMARQLHEDGQQVCTLALFDTVLPRAHLHGLRRRIAHRLGVWRRAGPRAARALIVERVKRELQRFRPRAQPSEPTDEVQHLDQLREHAYSERIVEYDRGAQPYPGQVLLFRALDADTAGPVLPGYGFETLASDLALHDIPGDHIGILRAPGVEQIAAHLNAALAR